MFQGLSPPPPALRLTLSPPSQEGSQCVDFQGWSCSKCKQTSTFPEKSPTGREALPCPEASLDAWGAQGLASWRRGGEHRLFCPEGPPNPRVPWLGSPPGLSQRFLEASASFLSSINDIGRPNRWMGHFPPVIKVAHCFPSFRVFPTRDTFPPLPEGVKPPL